MAVVVLVVGVVAARDGSAAQEADLRPPAVGPAPSPVPSLPETDLPLVVEADGVPGARLGTAGEDLTLLGVADTAPGTSETPEPPGGCVQAYPDVPWSDGGARGELAWLVDGRVASVVLTRWNAASPGPDAGLRTWLGPTLGSPIAQAEALPGARARTELPFGPDGPAVRVVHVPGEDAQGRRVEAVFSDATYDPFVREADVPRVNTLEVRLPEAAACSAEAYDAAYVPEVVADPGVEVALGEQGLTAAPLGTTVETLAGLPGFRREHTGEGCEAWSVQSPDGWARVVAVDGLVVEGHVSGTVRSDLPVPLGATIEQVVAAYPVLAGQEAHPAGRQLTVPLEGRVVLVEVQPELAWVPDVEVPVYGGPLEVAGLGVRAAASPATGC